MGHGRARIFNILTLIFVVATIAVAVWVVMRMMQPPPQPAQVAEAVPTLQELPTLTATHTPTKTPLPSFTPSNTPVPPTIPPTATPTNTPVPTLPTIAPTSTRTPTVTPTLPFTNTPTVTPLPPSSTPVPPTLTVTTTLPVTPAPPQPLITQQATVPPPSPFPFTLNDGQVIFTPNFANAAGCAWQGIGGQVFDQNGQPFTNARVHVFGSGLDTFAQAGSNSLYGPSGWEVPVGVALSGNVYQVELQTLTGTIISLPVTVVFTPNDCATNLALVNFAASRPF